MHAVQYIAVAIIFSNGYPWKRLIITNPIFSGWLAVVTVISIILFFWQNAFVYDVLSLQVWIDLCNYPKYLMVIYTLYCTQILPLDWNLRVLGMSFGSFVSYFIFLGIMQVIPFNEKS